MYRTNITWDSLLVILFMNWAISSVSLLGLYTPRRGAKNNLTLKNYVVEVGWPHWKKIVTHFESVLLFSVHIHHTNCRKRRRGIASKWPCFLFLCILIMESRVPSDIRGYRKTLEKQPRSGRWGSVCKDFRAEFQAEFRAEFKKTREREGKAVNLRVEGARD